MSSTENSSSNGLRGVGLPNTPCQSHDESDLEMDSPPTTTVRFQPGQRVDLDEKISASPKFSSPPKTPVGLWTSIVSPIDCTHRSPVFQSPPKTPAYKTPADAHRRRVESLQLVTDSPKFPSPPETPALALDTTQTGLRVDKAAMARSAPVTVARSAPVVCNEVRQLPPLDLSLFPAVFRTGTGASELQQVYSQFTKSAQLTVQELQQHLPLFGEERIMLYLELLARKDFLHSDNNCVFELTQTTIVE